MGKKLITTVPHCPPDLVVIPLTPFASKKQYGVTLSDTIVFSIGQKSGVLVVNNPLGLDNKDTPLFGGSGTKIAYVIQFPGYPSISVQKYAKTKRPPIPNNRVKALTQIGEVMEVFYEKIKYHVSTDPQAFRFGADAIELKDLYLLELRQVSRASFQPVFAVKRNHAILQCRTLSSVPTIVPAVMEHSRIKDSDESEVDNNYTM